MIIGITGNSGTGKTLLCKKIIENEKQFSLIDADEIAKELACPGETYFNEIVSLFGNDILTNEGVIDRKKLAEIIFTDSEKRDELDSLTYKYVVEEIIKRVKDLNTNVIIDAPLLMESGLNKICDIVISIICDRETKLERICARDNIDKKVALKRLDSQKEDDYYIQNSNYVIVNNENSNLEQEANDVIVFLKSKCYNNEIVIIQEKDLKILQFKRLLKIKKITHAYTLKPLDFGSNSTYQNINKEVENNYKTLCKLLKIDVANIIRPYQNHTKNVVKLENEKGVFPKELIDIDGAITDKDNKIISLVFADCTPIFLYDENKGIIANIHSGWQGTLKKIVMEAVNKMQQEFNCSSNDIICAIGPTIRGCHFEVDEDVKNEFVEGFKEICDEIEFVKKGQNIGKYYIDTVYLNKKMLRKCGVPEKNIIDSNICTVCNSNLMHSYRAEKENSGRSTAIICKKGE